MNSNKISVDWTNICPELLELLDKEWVDSKNVNAFLFAYFAEKYPIFQEQIISKGIPNKKGYYLNKSLLDRLVNKIMTNSHKNTGKKLKVSKLLTSLLSEKASKYKMKMSHLLILLLVKSVPNSTIRRLKFGSGHITRVGRLTVSKKISWFLSSIVEVLNSKKGGGTSSFSDRLGAQIDLLYANSPRSKLLTMKKELIANVQRANIQ